MPSPALPTDWVCVVDQIHESLNTALAAASAQEVQVTRAAEAVPDHTRATERLRQRLEAIRTCCERAERVHKEAEAALDATADGLVNWLAELDQAQRTLAEKTVRAIS